MGQYSQMLTPRLLPGVSYLILLPPPGCPNPSPDPLGPGLLSDVPHVDDLLKLHSWRPTYPLIQKCTIYFILFAVSDFSIYQPSLALLSGQPLVLL